MKQYATFIFDSYAFDAHTGTLSLRYSLDDEVHFEEIITFPRNTSYSILPASLLDSAFFNLHLICGISYFKTCLPKKMEIRSGSLTKEQAAYWNTVYTKGLGEFFFRNDIDFRDLIHFPSEAKSNRAAVDDAKLTERILVPFGGGKDSLVTAELLKAQQEDVTLLRVGSHPLIERSIAATGLPHIMIDRKISPHLLELNKEGALNGHVPATAIVSWIGVVAALLYDFKAIAMSNEKSASEGNAELHGMTVNHQWSKGREYEEMTAEYVTKNIAADLLYWSALRDLTELQVVEQFVKHEKYLPLAVSCNANWKIAKDQHGSAMKSMNRANRPSWCAACPKCAFVFALYAAYLPKQKVIDVFGENLFAKEELVDTYRELLGIAGIKPFECVGTPEETREAFKLAHARGEWNDDVVMEMYLTESPHP